MAGWRAGRACYSRRVIVESDIPVSWRTRPRGFGALMGLYETNYLRLEALAGSPGELAGRYRSCVEGDCELLLEVTGRSRYTVELLLTYELADGQLPARVPGLALRLYGDARVLEVLPPGDERDGRSLPVRWARNLMLNKWLEYLDARGHRFARAG